MANLSKYAQEYAYSAFEEEAKERERMRAQWAIDDAKKAAEQPGGLNTLTQLSELGKPAPSATPLNPLARVPAAPEPSTAIAPAVTQPDPTPRPTPQPVPTADDAPAPSPLTALLAQFKPQAPVTPQPAATPMPSGPDASRFDNDGAKLFGLLDSVFNRGASLKGLAAQKAQADQEAAQQYDKDLAREHTRAEIEHLKKAGVTDPVQQQIQLLRIENERNRAEGLGVHQRAQEKLDADNLALKERTAQVKIDPNHPVNVALRGALIKSGKGSIPKGAFDGLVGDDMLKVAGRYMNQGAVDQAVATAQSLVPVHADEAGAVSDARLPNELKLAQVKTDNAAELAKTRAGAKNAGTDDQLADIGKQYPEFPITAPSLTKAHLNGRGRNKYDTDMQNAAALYHSARDIRAAHDEMLAGPKPGEGVGEFAARIDASYSFAKKKAALFLTKLGGNSSDAAMQENLALFPGAMNVENESRINAIMPLLDHVIQASVAAHGHSVEGSDRAKEYAEEQAAADGEPVSEPTDTAPAPSRQPTPRAAAPTKPSAPAPKNEVLTTKIYDVTTPKGTTGQRAYTDADAAALVAKGWKLVEVK